MTKKTQNQKFIETAKELGCNESERDFEKKLKRITKPKDVPIKGKKGS